MEKILFDMTSRKQKEAEERAKTVCALYAECDGMYPNAARNRKLVAVAKRTKMSVQGVKNILVRKGMYQLNSK